MASKKQDQQEATGVENLNNSLTSFGEKIVKNKKVIFGVFGVIIVLALAFFGWKYLYQKPNNSESLTKYGEVEVLAQGNDSTAVEGYLNVAKEYEGYAGGNLAALRAGELLYDQGEYAKAIESLKKFSTDDELMKANAECLIGDCYVNLDKYAEAIEYFNKSIATAEGNGIVVARVMLKKANVYDAQKDYAKALECYETLKKDYPAEATGLNVDVYLAREKARLEK